MQKKESNERFYREEFKRYIVKEIQSGVSQYSLSKKHNISLRTFYRWMITFGDMKPSKNPSSYPVFSSIEEENAYLKKELKEREKACHQAQMKATALDTLIDVAEEKLKVSIRKKPGTKQS